MTQNDEKLRDKSTDILVAYGQTQKIVFEVLLDIVSHEVLNKEIMRAVIIVISYIWKHHQGANEYVEKAFSLFVEQVCADIDPYDIDKIGIIQSANRALVEMLKIKPQLVTKIYGIISSTKDPKKNYQMTNILSAASITDENLRRNIVLELSHLKNRFKKFRDIIEVYDSKADPKDLSLSQRPNVIPFKFSDYLKYCSLIVIAAILSLIYIKKSFRHYF